ncbi:MAG: phosphotransferase [Deltaproteobacteria bacterium]|nr:phosphotransferase [Deltaproteobacteria bacterium]
MNTKSMFQHAQLHDQLIGFVRAFAGGAESRVDTMPAQLSTRRYHRVATEGSPRSCVVMELPEDARNESDARMPFLNVHRYLSGQHFPVPKIYRAEVANGFIALEDLGDETLEAAVSHCRSEREIRALYRKAVSLIARLQEMGSNHPDPECLAFGRRFDYTLLRWELAHFREWLLEEGRGIRLTDAESAVVESQFDWLAKALADSPPVLVHRDFQSRNLMVVRRGGEPQISVIDFQDALLGPSVYDLVALLRDSYLSLSDGLVEELVTSFAVATGRNVMEITNLFNLQTVQRKLKDSGRFVFIDRKRGMPNFLAAIPLSLRYVRDAIVQVPELRPLHEILGRHVPELR